MRKLLVGAVLGAFVGMSAAQVLADRRISKLERDVRVVNEELYGQPESTGVKVNHLEDVEQATVRLCQLAGDQVCAMDLGITREAKQ